MNLLVVDWDYFFPTTVKHQGGTPADDFWLFDWGHHESNLLFYEALWPTRAGAFWNRGFDLPRCNDEWKNLWEQVKFNGEPEVFFADSNVWALHTSVFRPYEEVWLLDAHHDSGYREVDREKDGYSCEDWMLAYGANGSRLVWHPPAWCENAIEENGPARNDQPLNIVGDLDGAPEFDVVFICRSACWTPPWEDDNFMAFVVGTPADEVVGLDPDGFPYPADIPRAWNEEEARANNAATQAWFAQEVKR